MTASPSAPPRPTALHVLLEASSLLLYAGSEEQILAQTLDLASTLLIADAYGVWRVSTDDSTWNLIAHRGLSDTYPTTAVLNSDQLQHGVWVIEDVLTDPRAVFARSVYESEGIRSAMLVPWVLHGSVTGAIIFYCHRPRRFSQDDIDYATALSNLSLAALNRIELHEQTERERRRLAFLAEVSAVLASSLDYQATLERVARLAISHIAEWCTVHVVSPDQTIARVAVVYADPSMAALAERYESLYPELVAHDTGLEKVLQSAQPEIVSPITDDMLRLAAVDEQHLQLLRQFQLSASLVVPIQSRGKMLGAIRLLGTRGRHFGQSDLQLAMDLGRRAAVAIENAQLHTTLIEQANELRLSHAAAKMGSWTWDIERNQLSWSPEFKALHGLPQDVEPTGPESGYQLVHPEDRGRAQLEFWEALHSNAGVFRSEHRVLTPDGRILWIQVRGRIRRDPQNKPTWIAGLVIDVTESRLAEQALRRAEKLAAAGRLAATVAHEVNNPLESLINLIYLAQHTEGLPQDAASHLRMADAELRRIAHIVRQTLGFYRESTSPQTTEVRSLVADVLDLYRSRCIPRGLHLFLAPEPSTPVSAFVIAGEIKQVVANLVANAIDATPPGGTIQTSVRQLGHSVEIAVSDTGTGIPAHIRSRLFEPFFTTKADVGTGLGLWVSKGIVEKHGGTLSLHSAETPGTTFRVSLPLQPAP